MHIVDQDSHNVAQLRPFLRLADENLTDKTESTQQLSGCPRPSYFTILHRLLPGAIGLVPNFGYAHG